LTAVFNSVVCTHRINDHIDRAARLPASNVIV
jgi:hypothetical protein